MNVCGAQRTTRFGTPQNISAAWKKRFAEKPHSCEVEAVVYEHGTHFVFPDGMLKTMLPVGSALFVKLAFSAAKKYPRECKTARIDIDRRVTRVICDWRDKK